MIADDDLHLIEQAKKHLAKYFRPGRHHVAAALQCGRDAYYALHLDTSGVDICAEAIAVANALAAEETHFSRIVAVAWDGASETEPWVIAPCGDCRQLLFDYAPTIGVIVPSTSGIETATMQQLLPYPYRKPWERDARAAG